MRFGKILVVGMLTLLPTVASAQLYTAAPVSEGIGARPSIASIQIRVGGTDSAAHKSNRSLHIAVGVATGIIAGILVGKSIDGGRGGCGRELSGTTCDWFSGYEEPVLGVLGGLLGGIVGAFLPHN